MWAELKADSAGTLNYLEVKSVWNQTTNWNMELCLPQINDPTYLNSFDKGGRGVTVKNVVW